MNQINWIYVDDLHRQHAVGMLHGEKSGHLLIHVNSNIIVIDFNVLHDKKYSFFIQGELCEVSVEKQGDEEYGYSFVINDQVKTPRNIEIKKADRRDFIISLLVLGTVVLLVIIVLLLLFHFYK